MSDTDHTEQTEQGQIFSVEDLRAINPVLADFYERELNRENVKEVDEESIVRMDVIEEVDEILMHGHFGVGKGWNAPVLVTFCDVEARKGYNTMLAHEYMEDPVTLRNKVKAMAELITLSQHCSAYTGAGISTSSGIDDYASQSDKSVATGTRAVRVKKKSGLDAEPTFAHYTLAALYKAGHLKHWVQQNHDGLPQKAGFPQYAINEIHGAWFDPSNPVVPMDGHLRGDLISWLEEWEHFTDLVLVMGTSLSGMNADRMMKTCSKKFMKNGEGLGSIVIGFQRTAMDHMPTLRIFHSIDEVMLLLALEMKLPVSMVPYTPDIPEECKVEDHVFLVPYRPTGKKSSSQNTLWNLNVGAKLQLTGGPGKGFEGVVVATPGEGTRETSYVVQFPNTREGPDLGKHFHRYCLGTWFVEAACKGTIDVLPVINIVDE